MDSGKLGGLDKIEYKICLSIAPMMDYTDNHFRTLARLISKHAWLYTEMIAAETIVYQKGNLDRFLAFGPEQHPIVLQIGGSDLENIAKATQLANSYGYDEINFNCGCPSPKVAGKGCFGVRLMLDPKPLLGFFHSEPGNGLWKRKADAAFLHCTQSLHVFLVHLQTIKSFFEETLVAIPDSVLDSPITAAPIGFTDVFADAKRLLPPPHTVREEELLYA
ncbi:UNVERIFIED_CONTAM: tRNA-dihydrouridine(20/20a) synthase [Sesamum radiatum]|uniref:tRNA-dihydrouridine(20/20a) synthase n=1 Tax=Sesamum radiatum TaxID=300843 RepID=A0AAW2VBU1_SESRA